MLKLGTSQVLWLEVDAGLWFAMFVFGFLSLFSTMGMTLWALEPLADLELRS